MDFTSLDIHQFLRGSYPLRFQDISPYEFEDFIAFSLQKDGFVVEQTNYSGDFGADLVVSKKGKRTVIQVKRYQETKKVGVQDLNQVIAARKYYNADEALVITTSAFTEASEEMATKAEVYLWDWDDLAAFIEEVFFGGETFEEFYGADYLDAVREDEMFNLGFESFVEGDDTVDCILRLGNQSGTNAHIRLELPSLLSVKGRQLQATEWKEGYFSQGLLLNGAETEVCATFPAERLGELSDQKQCFLKLHIAGLEHPVLLETGIKRGTGCFVVTYCYGIHSREYTVLTRFRDEILLTNLVGQWLVHRYYACSPRYVSWLARGSHLAGPMKWTTSTLIRFLTLVLSIR